MICILKIDEHKEIKGWIIANDLRHARQQANGAAIGEGEDSPALQLLDWLIQHENTVPPLGKKLLPSGHLMLVS